ncbi:stage III sporulation protein AF [Konateibacter massiliensis]|uniref:stage III sporulation protein AF n=1 Tax=Konateibacter massiliensis TaxID=2002841 RepID=UPI000C15BEDE|nr:stage III sporulation protein AF [Konateibacter massiliensis]
MIAGIYQWIKNIAFYMILITAVMNVIPNNNYKKYINLFTGIVMIILVISPISSLLGADIRLDTNFIKNIYNQELGNINLDTYEISETGATNLLEEYKVEIGRQVEEIVEKEGYHMVEANITMDEDRESETYGNLEKIGVVLTSGEEEGQRIVVSKIQIGENQVESPEEISVKNVLEDFYNVGLSNINVNIQR